MRVLVCGTGFIGTHLARALVAAGHHVVSTVNNHEPEPRVEGVKYTDADLTVRGSWTTALACAKPEIVYMVAGKTGGSGLDPLHFVTDNALIALNMFRSCAEFGVKRIVAMSSTTGYPAYLHPVAEDVYFHGEPYPAYFNPGHTRRFIERLAAMYPQIRTTFIRCAGAFGPGDDFDPVSSHVIGATVRKVAERHDPIVIWGDGLAVRDGTYIDDLVRAIMLCEEAPAPAYNIGHGRGMSVRAIVDTLCEAAGYSPRIEYDLTKPKMIPARILNCSRANDLGWIPLVGMEDGLRITLDWYVRSTIKTGRYECNVELR